MTKTLYRFNNDLPISTQQNGLINVSGFTRGEVQRVKRRKWGLRTAWKNRLPSPGGYNNSVLESREKERCRSAGPVTKSHCGQLVGGPDN
jgi:hypothetical protein